MITKTKNGKIQKLFGDPRQLYHTQDLAVLWGISNANTLYTTIKRYIKRGLLYKIYKGFYSIVLPAKIDPIRLGLSALHRYGYLSVESVLAKEGIIFQDIKYITLVSGISRRFEIGNQRFLVRKMKDNYLYNDIGIELQNGARTAIVERAVADTLYFNSNYHFDAEARINWEKVREIKNKIGY